jgi:hypothetical protein
MGAINDHTTDFLVDDYTINTSNGIGIKMLKFCLDMRQMEKRRMVPEI